MAYQLILQRNINTRALGMLCKLSATSGTSIVRLGEFCTNVRTEKFILNFNYKIWNYREIWRARNQ